MSVTSTEAYPLSPVLGMIGTFTPLVLLVYFVPFTLPLAVGWGIPVSIWMLGVVSGADAWRAWPCGFISLPG